MRAFFLNVLNCAWWPCSLLAVVLPCSGFGQGTPEILWSTNAHTGEVTDVGFSRDGRFLLSGAWDQSAKLWSVSSRTLVRSVSIGFSDVGSLVSVAASRDGSLIGAGDGEGMVRVWRASDGQRLWIVGSHNNGVYGVAFNQPNDLFAFSNTQLGKEGYVALLDGPTAAPLPLDSSRRAAFGVSFSSDGTLLASANGDHRVSVWRVQDGAFLRDLVGHTGAVTSVDFASTGSLLASAAADGTARLWNATNGVELRVIAGGGGSWVPVSDRAARVRFSADGKTLLTRSNSTVRFWRVADGKLLLTYTNVGNGTFAVSPDGKHFAYGTGGPLDTNAAVVLARMPLLITNSAVRTNALNLEWQGGTGLYQIQHTSNVASLVWQDLGGPTSTTTTNVPVSATNTFFRVQSLEPPP